MCNYFSFVPTMDGRILFCERDSHHVIIQRAGLKDDSVFVRSYVSGEADPPSFDEIFLDEPRDAPGWFQDQRDEFTTRVMALAHRIDPHHQRLLANNSRIGTAYRHLERQIESDYKTTAGPVRLRQHAETEKLDRETTQRLRECRDKWRDQIDPLESQKAEELRALDTRHATELDPIRDRHRKESEALHEKYPRARGGDPTSPDYSEWVDESRTLHRHHRIELDPIRARHDTERQNLYNRFDAKTSPLYHSLRIETDDVRQHNRAEIKALRVRHQVEMEPYRNERNTRLNAIHAKVDRLYAAALGRYTEAIKSFEGYVPEPEMAEQQPLPNS